MNKEQAAIENSIRKLCDLVELLGNSQQADGGQSRYRFDIQTRIEIKETVAEIRKTI